MTLLELNTHIEDGTIDEVIRVAECSQRKELGKFADRICAASGVRLILLAGGSSSGKTTTAKRLSTQLRVNGKEVMYLSTDDYFVGDARNPRDERGNFDYEHVKCVDIERLSADINALFAGEMILERRFDFVNHVPVYSGRMISLSEGAYVILEGIHALNPMLTGGVDESCKFRIYIAPRPSIDVFGGITPKPEEARFLRRLVRDHHFRKINPAETLKMWPNVLEGEKKWIEPFKGTADCEFDSYLVYEMAVLKFYAGGLLERLRREVGTVTMVQNMIRLLAPITPIGAAKVPGDSILRETIGGSQLDY